MALVLLVATTVSSPLSFTRLVAAQETRERRQQGETEKKPLRTWPASDTSIVRNANETSGVAIEPVMRIALSTGTRAATISTTARLLNASDLNSGPQPLETGRVRVESRLLSPSRPVTEGDHEIEIARSLSREDAERTVELVNRLTGESARVTNE